MNSYYLLINIASISIPLIASFHPGIRFFKHHSEFFKAIGLSTVFFIIWDVFFAKEGVWGFSDSFTIGFGLFGLPLEEWLFFLCIPYASLFLHLQLHRFGCLDKLIIPQRAFKFLSVFLIGVVSIISVLHFDKLYTSINGMVFVLVYITTYFSAALELRKFLSSFVIILVPFFVVNGMLTGYITNEPVVWYNPEEYLGIRIGTIPLEDVFYAFSMLMLPLFQFYKSKQNAFSDIIVEH